MKLFSEVPITEPKNKIKHSSKILSIGSCFASEIGERLNDSGFQVLVNPFGTQFHPISIEYTFNRIYTREHYTDSEIFEYNGLYFSWDHSTNFSSIKKDKILTGINDRIDEANAFLLDSDVVIFTLGTAWAYYLTQGGFFVSNCHKIPQKHFSKRLLTKEQIVNSIRNLIEKIRDVRPNAQIIFTISPVRHIRDGYRENNVSKGVLHLAINDILNKYNDVDYFPSYEIAIDELRDYRYYASDLAHLNELGVDYIWEKFSGNYLTEEAQDLIVQIDKIKRAINHRPQNPESVYHKKFLYDTLKKAEELEIKLYPNALKNEIETLKKQINVY